MKYSITLLIFLFSIQIYAQSISTDTIELRELTLSNIKIDKVIKPKRILSKSSVPITGESPIFYSKITKLNSDILLTGVGIIISQDPSECSTGYYLNVAISQRLGDLGFVDISESKTFFASYTKEKVSIPFQKMLLNKDQEYFLKLKFESTPECWNKVYRLSLLDVKRKHGYTLIKHMNRNKLEDPSPEGNISFIFDHELYAQN